jgi:hypothetical protein
MCRTRKVTQSREDQAVNDIAVQKYRTSPTKENWDTLSKGDKILYLRAEAEKENCVLGLTRRELKQAEYEVYGAMSILFSEEDVKLAKEQGRFSFDSWKEKAQGVYYVYFVDEGYMPRPLKRFMERDEPAERYNAAGSLSYALIRLAAVQLELPDEVIEL